MATNYDTLRQEIARRPEVYVGPTGEYLHRAQGGWYIGPGGLQIWDPEAYFKKQAETNVPMSEFVTRGTAFTGSTPYDPAVNQFKAELDKYLTAPRPVMDTSNRFETGLAANEGRLNALLTDPEAVKETSAYKFRVGQGLEALQRQLGAKGLLASGNRLAEMTRYGQDMASQEYDTQANRLADLVKGYSASWLGDKSANTQKFAAESNAWNQRGDLLGNFYRSAGALANDRAGIQSRNALGWASVYQGNRPDRHYVNGGQAPMEISPFSVFR